MTLPNSVLMGWRTQEKITRAKASQSVAWAGKWQEVHEEERTLAYSSLTGSW